ncbi:MAG: hypothetical protein QOG72_2760 [Sphingomonadales bacterium]|jgi:hypothetical protein|nr:hypothetical protein [Sphingomonadales bacterium]
MPQVTGTLFEGKPIIPVTVADALPAPPSVSPQAEVAPFSLHHYRALLDTGADITCLCDNVISECRLRPYGFIRMMGSVGPSLHDTHIVRLGILCGDDAPGGEARGLYQLEPMEAAAIRPNRWFDIIIGTDVISQHELRLTKGGGFAFILS